MGAQLSALSKDIVETLPRNMEELSHKIHVAGHYIVIPAIYIFGLMHAKEMTWNPLSLLEKIFIA
jgi:hypothetical protein